MIFENVKIGDKVLVEVDLPEIGFVNAWRRKRVFVKGTIKHKTTNFIDVQDDVKDHDGVVRFRRTTGKQYTSRLSSLSCKPYAPHHDKTDFYHQEYERVIVIRRLVKMLDCLSIDYSQISKFDALALIDTLKALPKK